MKRYILDLAVFLVLLCVDISFQLSTSKLNKESACPNADDIAPCTCYASSDNKWVDLDCSMVKDSDQLGNIFQANFPVKQFSQLVISNNQHIKELPEGVFNDVAFETISIQRTSLSHVDEGTFKGSKDVLKSLKIVQSKLTDDGFPFSSLKSYKALEVFHLSFAKLTKFPKISSDSLARVNFLSNKIHEVATDSFDDLPHLIEVGIGKNGLKEIPEGVVS